VSPVSPAPAPSVAAPKEPRVRLRAALLSLTVAILLFVAKLVAYRITGSAAVLSDALEAIVNVLAAAFAVGSLVFAGRPADRNHPYGHGKIEFLSAAFEGGLIVFAAILILYESMLALWLGPEVRDIDRGLAIVLGAGLCNLALGLFLVRVGARHESLTLVADGEHVLSDAWTSAGVVAGLSLVRWTGWTWLDPTVAMLVALFLLRTGVRLVRRAAAGLLDEEDSELLKRLLEVLRARVGNGVIRVHGLRAMRAGRFHHVTAHLVLPEFWSLERAHETSEDLAAEVIRAAGVEGELIFHADPCHRAYCARCDLADCPVRREPFRGTQPLTLEEAVQPDMSVEERERAKGARSS
jgi:cation diffusion facilitator family transporter